MGDMHEIVCLRRDSICQQDTKERFSPQNTQEWEVHCFIVFSLTQVVSVTWLNEGSST